MSVTTYSDLQNYVTDALERADVGARVPDFITLAETEFNRSLRTRQMRITISSTPSSGQFSLPTDFLTWENVVWTGSPRNILEYVDPQVLELKNTLSSTGTPLYFSVLGTTDSVGVIKTAPTDTTAIDFTYYQKITALSTSNTSNWLLAAHPDLYVAASLYEGFKFLKEYDDMLVWKQCRDEYMDSIVKLDQKYRGPASISVIGVTP